MYRYIFLFTLVLFPTIYGLAQDDALVPCGTSKIVEEALKNPEKKQIMDQLELFTQEFIANWSEQRKASNQITIPVVVHVIHNYGNENISYEQIDQGIARINEDFNGLNDDLSEVIDSFTNIIGYPEMKFRLATIDPDGNPTYGVTRTASLFYENTDSDDVMSLINWDSKKYVNIYVVRSFDANMSSAAAYATKPGNGGELGDYIFCRYDYFGDWNVNTDSGPTENNARRHTLPHEMGHFFNLDHPWGGTNSPGDTDANCTIDDGVEDTPPTAGTDGNAVGCPLNQTTCGDELDNVQNIMDYSSCAHMFTQGQSVRMLAAAESFAGNRYYLWQDQNLIATGTDDAHFLDQPHANCAPIPDFISDIDLGCENEEISFADFTYNYRNQNITYTWNFEGGDASSTSDPNPVVMYPNSGTYDVSLTTCNGNNCNTIVKENYITILSKKQVSLEEGVTNLQSFESNSFPNITETNEIWWLGDNFNQQHWEITNLASTEGGSSYRIKSQGYNANRRSHEFSSPQLDLSEFSTTSDNTLQICFDYAYAKRLPYFEFTQTDNPHSIHNDALVVSYKTSCDANWNERPRLSTRPGQEGSFLNKQEQLITTDSVYFNNFIPNEDQWRTYCLNIQQLAGSSEAVIKFEFKGTGTDIDDTYLVADENGAFITEISAGTIGGNWLYIDNIAIGNESSFEEISSTRNSTIENLVISPNPSSNDNVLASLNLNRESEVKVTLTSFLGRVIGSKHINLNKGHNDLSISDIFNIPNQGSFILEISTSNTRLSNIIIIR